MEGGLTDSNRQRCAEAAKPLLHAVETLTTFAVSPEFASKPATISAKVTQSLIYLDFTFTVYKFVFCLLMQAAIAFCQDSSYRLSARGWPAFSQYQIIFLDARGTCVNDLPRIIM